LQDVVTFKAFGNEEFYQFSRPKSSPPCRGKSWITADRIASGNNWAVLSAAA
jgi:hypothetical protein